MKSAPTEIELAACLFGAVVFGPTTGDKPFTPATDLQGNWNFTADPELPHVLLAKHNAVAAREIKQHDLVSSDRYTLTRGLTGKFLAQAGDIRRSGEMALQCVRRFPR
jgi:hypothetical protein